MDSFFDSIPIVEKRRVHFHAFFRELHQQMFENIGSNDAMGEALNIMLSECRLLCFDEFHLHDIGDAMLISRLFKAIFARRCVLLTTSNYPPAELLPNPIYHERFLPTIRLIESHMDILSIAGDIDYRSLNTGEADTFHRGAFVSPGDPAQREMLGLPAYPVETHEIKVNHRLLRGADLGDRTIYFTFEDLCESATAVMDYLVLVDQFDYWILSGLPKISSASAAAQQRFLNLIDILYDRRCTLFLISPLSLDKAMDLCEIADIGRTRSRLSQLRRLEK
ncbi:cell division protein ZapE [Azorhizophilus paspali]|uniref:cell division protein ZapE n=1 Tax=Azorhizophilus paspali TaxID=69963 RepID=UPI00363475F4